MSTLKPITVNRLLRLLDQDAVEQFRQDFPHIFIPNEATSLLYGFSGGFSQISRELIIQHWITADALQLTTKMRHEVERKEYDLSDAIAKGHGTSDAPTKNPSVHVDPEFNDIYALWLKEAQKERKTIENEGEEFYPDEHSEMGMTYHEVLHLAEQTIENFRSETIKRAISGLYRVLETNLKAMKDADEKLNHWVEPEPAKIKKESDLIYLFRKFEANIPNLDTGHFRKKSALITELKGKRNKTEHESDVDLSDITEEDLIRFFEEIKYLFEAIEKARPNPGIARVRIA